MNTNLADPLSITMVPLSPSTEGTHLMAPIPISGPQFHSHHPETPAQPAQLSIPFPITPPLYISTTPSIYSSQPQSTTTSPMVTSKHPTSTLTTPTQSITHHHHHHQSIITPTTPTTTTSSSSTTPTPTTIATLLPPSHSHPGPPPTLSPSIIPPSSTTSITSSPSICSTIPGILIQHQPPQGLAAPQPTRPQASLPLAGVSPAPSVSPAVPTPSTSPAPRHHSSGGLKKSTETSKNNSRVSLLNNPVARRCVQEVRPFKAPITVGLPAIRARAARKISRRNCKGVLVQHSQEFHILKLFGGNRTAHDLQGEDKVWVYIPEKGTIQLAWNDIESAIDENDCCDDVIRVDLVSEGYVRPLPQKVGTRLRNDAKLLKCLQLDFGAEIQDCNKWLWVEDSALFGEKPFVITSNSSNNNSSNGSNNSSISNSSQPVQVPSSPFGEKRSPLNIMTSLNQMTSHSATSLGSIMGAGNRVGGAQIKIEGINRCMTPGEEIKMIGEDGNDVIDNECYRRHRHHHRHHHYHKKEVVSDNEEVEEEEEEEEEDNSDDVESENSEDVDDDVECGANLLIEMFRSNVQ